MMTRIAAFLVLTAGLSLADTAADVFVVKTVKVAGKERAFRLLLPLPGPEAKPVPAPVVVFLHGAGERGTDNLVQLNHFPEKMAQPEWRA